MRRAIGFLVAAVLVAAGCGSSDEEPASTTSGEQVGGTTTTAAGTTSSSRPAPEPGTVAIVDFQFTPREITVEDYEAFFASFETGTPAPDVMTELVWVGYTAILSPGQTVWVEVDLAPGNYTPTSWVIDPETGAPALLLGMIANYEVVA